MFIRWPNSSDPPFKTLVVGALMWLFVTRLQWMSYLSLFTKSLSIPSDHHAWHIPGTSQLSRWSVTGIAFQCMINYQNAEGLLEVHLFAYGCCNNSPFISRTLRNLLGSSSNWLKQSLTPGSTEGKENRTIFRCGRLWKNLQTVTSTFGGRLVEITLRKSIMLEL